MPSLHALALASIPCPPLLPSVSRVVAQWEVNQLPRRQRRRRGQVLPAVWSGLRPWLSGCANPVIGRHPAQSFTPHHRASSPGLLANWTVRSMVKTDAADVVLWGGFLTVWVAVVHLWARAKKIPITGSQLSIFVAALVALRDDGKLIYLALDISPPTPQSPLCKAKAT